MNDVPDNTRLQDLRGRAGATRAWLQGLGALVLDRMTLGRPDTEDGATPTHDEAGPDREVTLACDAVAANGRQRAAPEDLPGGAELLAGFDPRPVLVVAEDPRSVAPYVRLIRTAGLSCVQRDDLSTAIADCSGPRSPWACLVADLDGFGGVRPNLARFLALRRAVPDLPVVLLSDEVTLNDLSTERLAITDVTLRSPTHPLNFALGVIQALENNQIWQGRVSDYSRAAWEAVLPPPRRARLKVVGARTGG